MIPYGRQSINAADIAAVEAVLRSDFLTQGPAVPAFEAAVSGYCGVPHAVAVNSATSALHIACLALDLGAGDWLWTSPNTFVASANCALYCGAQVDFVDIDPRTYNLCPRRLEVKLERAQAAGRLPKVVVAVHFAGQSCDMAAIWELAQRYGFAVIEDASHAIGASYRSSRVGSCSHSHITVFSFHPVKIITTGEGGLLTTRDPALHDRLARLRTHGITRAPEQMTTAPEGPWYYQQIDLGYNYRMTDIQAALGLSQFQRLDEFIARRREHVARYRELLAGLPVTLPFEAEPGHSAWHLYAIRVQGQPRRQVFERLRELGIGVNVHYIPVHLQPYYRRMGFAPGDFPEAESYYESAISLPMYSSLSTAQQAEVAACLRRALQV